MDRHEQDTPWGAIAFVFVLLAAVLVFAILVSRPAGKPGTAPAEQPAAHPGELEQFWADVAGSLPEFTTFSSECPVDGTTFEVPNTLRDNRLGGTSTDLMKIALVSEEQSNKPAFDVQEFEQKLVTCPACAATFIAVDLSVILGGRLEGAQEKLKQWSLGQAVPGLGIDSQPEWSYDTRAFLRYRTQQQAGYPETELVFTALQGAWCANFDVWYGGRDYAAPSAAYYALAAARLKSTLEQGQPEDAGSRSANAMLLGELYRLLGRARDAATWFAESRNIGGLDPRILPVLEASEARLAQGSYELARVPDAVNADIPPFGWQIDLMLPIINSHIAASRPDWAALDDPVEIEQAIGRLAAGKYSQ